MGSARGGDAQEVESHEIAQMDGTPSNIRQHSLFAPNLLIECPFYLESHTNIKLSSFPITACCNYPQGAIEKPATPL